MCVRVRPVQDVFSAFILLYVCRRSLVRSEIDLRLRFSFSVFLHQMKFTFPFSSPLKFPLKSSKFNPNKLFFWRTVCCTSSWVPSNQTVPLLPKVTGMNNLTWRSPTPRVQLKASLPITTSDTLRVSTPGDFFTLHR